MITLEREAAENVLKHLTAAILFHEARMKEASDERERFYSHQEIEDIKRIFRELFAQVWTDNQPLADDQKPPPKQPNT